MTRSEFSPSIRMQAFDRCKGFCEGKDCGSKLWPGKFAYDHIQADGLGGKPTLSNCAVLCDACHGIKTHQHDRPLMAKADRIKKKHIGAKAKGRGFPKPPAGYNPWTRRIEG